ncbi:MAG: FAD-dependent oxidoreductase [Bacillota bacterium]
MYDVIIIGRGPAGISAALYTVRAGLKTLVIGIEGKGTLTKDHKIENYYGFVEPISSIELLANGEKQAIRLGVEIIDAEVTSVDIFSKLLVKTSGATYEAETVLLATGQARKKAGIPDEERFAGKGVSYCAVCDGFFYKDKFVVVVGDGDFALAEAREMKGIASSVTILTNGKEPQFDSKEFPVITEKITGIFGDEVARGIIFEDTSRINGEGIFIAEGTASATDFAKKLGIEFEGLDIKVNEKCETNFPGIFAAGDCIGGFRQIATAVGEGAIASRQIIEYCRKGKTDEKKL